MSIIKSRQYGEPIHEDAPGFNPTVHRDLVEEINEVLDTVASRHLVGPEDASGTHYNYRQRGDEVQFYDRTLGIWRTLSRVPGMIPAWQAAVTTTNGTSLSRQLRVQTVITTDKARADGADFRAYSQAGVSLPCRIAGVTGGVGGMNTYTLITLIHVNAGASVTFNLAWGDPNASMASYTVDQVSELLKPPLGTLGLYTLDQNAGLAYKPSNFTTAGAQVTGARDDVGTEFLIPNGGIVIWNGTPYTKVGLNSNGALEFGGNTNGRPTSVPDAITWGGNGDLYESWVRFVELQDGYAWHILTGNGGYTANFKLTIRYYHGGRWTMTLFHNTSSWPSQIGVKIGGSLSAFTSPSAPVETGTPYVIDLSTGSATSTVAETIQVASLRTDAGLLPITTDMVYSPSGNLQVQLQMLTDRIAALEALQ